VKRSVALPALAAVALAVAVVPRAAAATVAVQATAGVGGIAKANRWSPVRVVIASDEALPAAELHVEWGDARVRRALAFGSPGTRTIELLLRASEPASAMHVSLRSGGAVLSSVDAPLSIAPAASPVVLCIGDPLTPPAGASCSTHVAGDNLPRSVRGYEGVDQLVWADADPLAYAALSDEQQAALRQWRVLRQLDEQGELSLSPKPVQPPVRGGLPWSTNRILLGGSALYLVLIAALAVQWTARVRRVGAVYGAFAATAALAIAAAAMIGRAGPATAVRLHHSSVVEQIPGTSASLISTKGVLEFPSLAEYEVRVATADASLLSGSAGETYDADGRAIIRGRFGLGAKQSLQAEAVAPLQPIDLSELNGVVRVRNRSEAPLRNCRFGDGVEGSPPRTLAPGEVFEGRRIADGLGPLVICSFEADSVLPLHIRGRRTVVTGSSTVVVYSSVAVS
jgi:hypothetical protein